MLLAIGMTWLLPWYAKDLASGGIKPATFGNPAHTIVGDVGDPAAQAWLIALGGHALRRGLHGLWDTNAFYPGKYALALSDTLLGYAPVGLVGDGVTAAILRYNIMFVLAFALAFLGGYALARQLGANRVGGAVAGAALAYAPWRYGHVDHLNILSTGGITLAFAMLARGHGWSMARGYLRERVRPGWAVAGWLVAAWQVSLGFGVGLPFVYVLAFACRLAGARPPIAAAPADRGGPRRGAVLHGDNPFLRVLVSACARPLPGGAAQLGLRGRVLPDSPQSAGGTRLLAALGRPEHRGPGDPRRRPQREGDALRVRAVPTGLRWDVPVCVVAAATASAPGRNRPRGAVRAGHPRPRLPAALSLRPRLRPRPYAGPVDPLVHHPARDPRRRLRHQAGPGRP
ncbi:hypothetical protein [Dactylosporangium sp. CA-233914]|uniref:hypothetical protein n=1 Tax=Dactylosporangium sp. CA-233914 TaxID=3239934 RepID=UPI003D913042